MVGVDADHVPDYGPFTDTEGLNLDTPINLKISSTNFSMKKMFPIFFEK